MARVLARDVHVTGEDNQVVILKAGDKVPKKFADYVTNPKAYVEVVEVTGSGDDGSSTPDGAAGYDGLKGPQLKKLLKDRELPQSGTNAEMIERLKEFDAEQVADGAGEGSGDDGSSTPDEDDEENQE